MLLRNRDQLLQFRPQSSHLSFHLYSYYKKMSYLDRSIQFGLINVAFLLQFLVDMGLREKKKVTDYKSVQCFVSTR